MAARFRHARPLEITLAGLALAGLLQAGHAHAQAVAGPMPVALEVAPGTLPGPEVEVAVRTAIAQELGRPVVPTTVAPAAGRLTIALDREHRLVVSYRDPAGHEVLRAIAVPQDPAAVIGTIALLAGNLARNEAQDLVASLAPPAAPPAPAPPPAPPAPPVACPVLPAPAPAPAPVAVAVAGTPPLSAVPAPLQDRVRNDIAEDRLHQRRGFVIHATGAAGWAPGRPPFPQLDVGVRYRLHHWGVGLDGLYVEGGGDPNYTRTVVTPMVFTRQMVGPLDLDLGLGAGAAILGVASGSSELAPVFRVAGTLALPLTRWLDLVVRADLQVLLSDVSLAYTNYLAPPPDPSRDPTSTGPEDISYYRPSAWQFSLGLGLQVRL